MSVGIGYDSHRFAEGRRLVLGGVEIEHERGLAGHSDADVLTHAVIDALLGAAGVGDIGTLFPDDDERWRDADSIDLLRTVVGTIAGRIVNVDATVVCEEPRLGAATGRRWSGSSPRRPRPGSASRRRPTRGWAGSAAARESPAWRSLRSRANSLRGPMGSLSSIAVERRGSRSPTPSSRSKVLHEAGILGLMRPDKAAKIGSTFLRWGASPATGDRHRGDPPPARDRDHRRARARSPSSELHRRSNALAHAFAGMGIGYGDGVGIMCRNHRGFVEATAGRGQARRQRALPQHDVRRPAAGRGDASARARRRSSTTRSSPACSRASTEASRGSSAGRRRRGRRADARGADRRRRRLRPEAARPTSRAS